MNLLRTLSAQGRPLVLITLAAARDTPRQAGAHMVVTPGRTLGTIGGGDLEYGAVTRARAMLADGFGARLEWSAALCSTANRTVLLFELLDSGPDQWAQIAVSPFDREWVRVVGPENHGHSLFVSADAVAGSVPDGLLGEWAIAEARALLADASRSSRVGFPRAGTSGQCLFLDLVRAPDLRVTVFGAGHVGRAIVGILGIVPCEVCWIDSRPELLAGPVTENVEMRLSTDAGTDADDVRSGSYCVVSTHSHEIDREICGRLLRRDDLPFVGLIGSRRKRASFEEHWSAAGMDAGRFARLVCPVGIEGVSGRSPGEIAVATVAQMLQVRDGRS